MFPLVGAAISAGGNLLSGMMARDAQSEANAQNYASSEAARIANLTQNTISNARADQQYKENMDWAREQYYTNIGKQDEYAKMGIRYKVADAISAGLHPLYALGGGVSYSPSSVTVGSTSAPTTPAVPYRTEANTAMARSLGAMGQDIGRAVAATQTADERVANEIVRAQAVERGGLENDLLRSQIAKIRSQTGPAFPSGPDPFGIGDVLSGAMRSRNQAAESTRLGITAGTQPGTSVYRDPGGLYAAYPSEKLKEAIEDVMPYEWEDYLKKRILPEISGHYRDAIRPTEALEPGYAWHGLFGHWWKSPRNRWTPILGR